MLRLTSHCSLKLLEDPAVYNRSTDELYIVNQKAFDFLAGCAGSAYGENPPAPADEDFLKFCLAEGILEQAPVLNGRDEAKNKQTRIETISPRPSLRYLLLHITNRCNLNCKHCYGGEAGTVDMSPGKMMTIIDEFTAMQGLRLMISGGEPLLHPDFSAVCELLEGADLRKVLLTNGTLLSEEIAGNPAFDEVQISLDGMRDAHDSIRGPGAFEQSLAGLRLLVSAGVPVSVATMIHRGNLADFDPLEDLLREIGVREWSIDVPSSAGRLSPGSDMIVDPEIAGPLLARSYGGGVHEPLPGYACGCHLLAVMADGRVARCAFYAAESVGFAEEGLASCWQKIPRMKLDDLECDCEFVNDCRGGCRFRAAGYNDDGNRRSPDWYQCARYGV